MYLRAYATLEKKKSKRRKLKPGLLKAQEEPALESSAHGPHEKELGLPRALRDVVDAAQNQVLQLYVAVANAPKLFDDWRRLIRL